jgi:hypothetical protein
MAKALAEKRILKVFKNKELKIFNSKANEVTGS